MAASALQCPQCKEIVESLAPCPLCGYKRRRRRRIKRPRPIEPLDGIARWTVRLLLFHALAGLFSFSLTMMVAFETPDRSPETFLLISSASSIPDCFMSLVWLVATIFFLVWQYRIRENYDRLQVRSMNHSPLMNVLWWMIPVANLFMPYLVLQELWRAGSIDVADSKSKIAWRRTPACPLIRTYWIVFIGIFTVSLFGMALLLTFAFSWNVGGDDMESFYKGLMIVQGITTVGDLARRFLEVFIVERLTSRQQAFAEHVEGKRAAEQAAAVAARAEAQQEPESDDAPEKNPGSPSTTG